MGSKEREFGPLDRLTLENLVPTDHFYRHLEKTLDLGFVRDLVRADDAPMGRPSVDPIVFFKLQLVLFFEGLRSERQLMCVVGDRLSLRWYVAYDLGEPLPDHSSLTRIRDRYGLETLRRFFEAVVEQCQNAGLVSGKELDVEATKVEATASLDSVGPRFAIEAHLQQLFASEEMGSPRVRRRCRRRSRSRSLTLQKRTSRRPMPSGTTDSPATGGQIARSVGGATSGRQGFSTR